MRSRGAPGGHRAGWLAAGVLVASACAIGNAGERSPLEPGDASAPADGHSSASSASGGSSSGGDAGSGSSSSSSGSTSSSGGEMVDAGAPEASPEASGTCGPQTCAGCCSGGVCIDSPSDQQCGSHGVACQDCVPSGETCSGGFCRAESGAACSPSTCPNGCCQGTLCWTSTDTKCGTGGAACWDCTTNGGTCQNGLCASDGGSCTPFNCAGCCDSTGACQMGTTDSVCAAGTASIACVDCATQMKSCSCLAVSICGCQ